jgi:hypothetical protein
MAQVESAAQPSPSTVFILSPAFKMVFLGVLTITVLSMLITCTLVALNNETAQGKALFELCASICKMGFGAIVGLLGGKAIQ